MRKTINLLSLAMIIALVLSSCSGSRYASKANSLKESGKLTEALELINSAIDPNNAEAIEAGAANDPKTWETRGDIYNAIFNSKDAAVKKLSSDPLTKAWNSYKKAMALDEKGGSKPLKIKLTLLTNALTNQAVGAFQKNDYKTALRSFEQRLEIQDTKLFKEDNPAMVDTSIIYNAGLAAYNGKEYDKAIQYFQEAAKHNYGGAKTCSLIANTYQLKGDTVGALDVLKKAFVKHPNDNNVLTSMIQIYLDTDQSESAMKYLDLAIKQDPKNPRLHFAKGTLFEKLKDTKKAADAYKDAIKIDPKNFNAYYNLGALYYNKGVAQTEVARSVPASNNAKYMEELKKADDIFAKAIPYFEKANKINPEDKMPLESLKTLYYRLKMMDKYNTVMEKLGN